MTLAPGSRLGPYEITAPLGAGGMGEVYRARDLKLQRDVALKVLLPAVASDPDRLARFGREAQVLASLNHPNIGAIHGLEESGGVTALVLELVDGPTLADRMAGASVPLDEALLIAKQIAEALEAAHEHGIIHRDLKPANIKLRTDGTVKVLDFGLAKAISGEATASVANSPTLSLAATQAGMILGTAAYMSPEQAKGKPVDRRVDIWAFGIVLFEMLTGRMAYAGETASETMAQVIMNDPDWTALPAHVPVRLRELLQRCLVKEPRNRVRDIGDVRLTLDDIIARPERGSAGTSAASVPLAASRAPTWRTLLPWTIAAVTMLALAAALWTRRPPAPPPVMRMSVDLSGNATLVSSVGPAAVLSPDGQSIVMRVSIDGGPSHLVLRRLKQLENVTLSGTENAWDPFFSPDGQWIGFFADRKLKKTPVDGGSVVTLCDAPVGRGGSWSTDDTIVFAATTNSPLMRVSSAGGTPEALTTLAEGEMSHRYPQILPGGDAVLYTARKGTRPADSRIVVQSLRTGERTTVRDEARFGRYVPSGHILFASGASLFAIPFDLANRTTGQAVPVIEGVAGSNITTAAQYAVSDTGLFAYLPGRESSSAVGLYWMTRDGKTAPLRNTRADYHAPRFSPDGRQLAVEIRNEEGDNIWVHEWETDRMARLTVGPRNNKRYPVWTPDGSRIAYAEVADEGSRGLYWQRADGAGDGQRLTEGRTLQRPTSFHPSGRYLAFEQRTGDQGGTDIMILPLEEDAKAGWKPGPPYGFLATPSNEAEPAFSPDGRWLAYESNESGNTQVYVRPFPGPGGKWQVSTASGVLPTWSRDGKHLFYRTLASNQELLVVSCEVQGDSFRAGRPELWSKAVLADRGASRNFDLHPDGQRFAVFGQDDSESETPRNHVVLVLNFFDELRRLAAVQ